MTKFNITLAVSAETLPSLMNDLPVYCAELVRVEQGDTLADIALLRQAFDATRGWRRAQADGICDVLDGAIGIGLQQLKNAAVVVIKFHLSPRGGDYRQDSGLMWMKIAKIPTA